MKRKTEQMARCLAGIAVLGVGVVMQGCRVEVKKTVSIPPAPTRSTIAAEPIHLTVHLIDGTDIIKPAMLDNMQVSRAEAVPLQDAVFQVKLHLTPEGRDVIRKVTQQNVGKRIGFFLDGDLKCSPEILEPLDIPYVMLPVRTTAAEAERIAEGIMKGTSQQGGGHVR